MEGPTYVKDINYDIEKIQKQLATGEEAAVEQQALTENDFRFTTRDGFLYVIAMGWPQNGEWKIRTLKSGTGKYQKHISSWRFKTYFLLHKRERLFSFLLPKNVPAAMHTS